MILHMPYWSDDQTLTVPDDTTARIAKYQGAEVIVINDRYYCHYSNFAHRKFCRGVREYHDYIEGEAGEAPEYRDVMNMESLLAYAYYRRHEWVDTQERIARLKVDIENLCMLTCQVENI